MPTKKCALSKAKGVQMIADELFAGKERRDILEYFITTYKLSRSAFDKWLKDARILAHKRMADNEAEKKQLLKETTEALVKRLGLTQEAILTEYRKVAFFDIRKLHDEDGAIIAIKDLDNDTAGGIAGIEAFDVEAGGQTVGTTKKIKLSDKVRALDSIRDMLGYAAPKKTAQTDAAGNDVPITERDVKFK